eukprot:2238718-Pyramimonas_sp.AAC.1
MRSSRTTEGNSDVPGAGEAGMSSPSRWLEIAIPRPMYWRSPMVCGLPSPTSDPAKAVCSWQMEHPPMFSCVTSAGRTRVSSTRRGASRVKSRVCIPAHVFGHLCLAVTSW